jgi:hypothetical protein
MKSTIFAIILSAAGAMADRYYSCGHMLVNDPCEFASLPRLLFLIKHRV